MMVSYLFFRLLNMKYIKKSGVLLVCLVGLLGGCATKSFFPSDPKAQALWYVESATKQAEQGNFERVSFMLTEATLRPGGVDAVKDFLAKSSNVSVKLSEYFEKISKESNNKEELNNLALYVSSLGNYGLIKDLEKISKEIQLNVVRKNSTGEINWLLTDDVKNLHSLQSPEAQKIIFERSLEAVTNTQKKEGLAKSLADYISKPRHTSIDFNGTKQKLWSVNLRRTDLEEFKNVFPDLVSAKLSDLTTYIQLELKPSDRLMEEDLKSKIKNTSINYVVLKSGEKSNPATINITVEKLRSEERQLPNQSQTITYSRSDVDFLKSALLMPSNSSYMYEWKTGGVELEYGYVVRLNQNGKILLDELIRGTITEKFVNCDNPRIVNVFGGTTRAEFVANNDMSSKCAGANNSSPSMQDVKERVLTLLVDKIVSVEALAKKRE